MNITFVCIAGSYINLNSIVAVDVGMKPPKYVESDRTIKITLAVHESISDSLDGLRGESRWYTPNEAEKLLEHLAEISI